MTLEPVLDGLGFAECPRWHDGKLWFSDIFNHRVMTVDEHGNAEIVVELPEDDLPAGLGFLPDGRLLIANLAKPNVLRLDGPGRVSVHADVAHLAVGILNDMAVDGNGRAYVGSMGTDELDVPRPVTGTGNIICIEPDGSSRIVAAEMDQPNGPAISVDDRQYVVASFPSGILTGFDRNPDGSLSNRRVWADLRPFTADGICIDAANGVWTCSPLDGLVRRVLEGGEVTDEIDVRGDSDKIPLVPCLGGHDGRTLFILSVLGGVEAIATHSTDAIVEKTRVEVPGW